MLPMIQPGEAVSGPPPFERVGIVGFGLIGGSLGLALRRAWPSMLVVAVDRKEVIETAMRLHAADVGGDDLGFVSDTELIVLAAPVLANNETLASLESLVPGQVVVTDVGSTKRSTVAAARVLPQRLPFIGGHPLAGAAAGGLGAARADLFTGRPWILTPRPDADPAALARLTTLVEGVGARPQRMTAEDHDRLVAAISHLPQLVASALMDVVGTAAGESGLALAGRGLRDTTRLASSPPAVWRDIIVTNGDHIESAIDALIAILLDLKADIDGQAGVLERTFATAAEWKRVLEEKG